MVAKVLTFVCPYCGEKIPNGVHFCKGSFVCKNCEKEIFVSLADEDFKEVDFEKTDRNS